MTPVRLADGSAINADILGVLDESSPPNGCGGVAFVVATAALLLPNDVKLELSSMFESNRKRPFHWAEEGPTARSRMLNIIATAGVVSVVYHSHVGRRQQASLRSEMVARAATWANAEGVGHLIIEAGDRTTIGRDRATLLDTFRESGGVPFHYDWRSKSESLVWIADAVAGAVGEFITGKEAKWCERLLASNVVNLVQLC